MYKSLPSRLRIRIHKEGEKFPLLTVCKYGFKSLLNAKRLLPRPWKLHNGPFLLNVVYRDAAVGYGVNNTQGTQTNGHCAEHFCALNLDRAPSELRSLYFLLTFVKSFFSSTQLDLDTAGDDQVECNN